MLRGVCVCVCVSYFASGVGDGWHFSIYTQYIRLLQVTDSGFYCGGSPNPRQITSPTLYSSIH